MRSYIRTWGQRLLILFGNKSIVLINENAGGCKGAERIGMIGRGRRRFSRYFYWASAVWMHGRSFNPLPLLSSALIVYLCECMSVWCTGRFMGLWRCISPVPLSAFLSFSPSRSRFVPPATLIFEELFPLSLSPVYFAAGFVKNKKKTKKHLSPHKVSCSSP